MKFSDDVGDPSYFPTHFSDFLCHDSFRRYSQLSLEVVENRTNVKVFGSQFLRGTSPTFYGSLLALFSVYCPPLGKVWLSSICWSPSAKRGNKVECRIYGGWTVGENSPPIWSRLWTKVYIFLRRYRKPHWVCNARTRLCISCFIPEI